jgi:peroxiredoxin
MDEKIRGPMRARFQRNNEAIDRASIAFIYEHPDYYFALSELAFRIKYYPTTLVKNKVISFYGQVSKEQQENEYGQMVRTYIQNTASLESPAVKDKSHPFTLHDASGTSVSLASLKGKVVLLDFWFAGCAPCRQEHKNYLKAYTEYRQKGFEILSVNIDANKVLWTAAMQQDSMIWKSVWDEGKKVTEDLYHISGYPSNFLINAKGVIVAKDLRGEALLERLRKML